MGRISHCLLLALFAPAAVQASEFLVARHNASGWTLEDAESVQINGKDKVRSTALSATPQTWDAKTISHLANGPLGTFSAILRAPDGTLLAANGSGGWQLLLPDNEKSKTAQSAADIWKNASITIRKDRKDKASATLNLAELYAILPGQDASLSAARLATDISLHKLPGMDDSAAFQQMLGIIPAAAKSYSSGPAAEKIREYVRGSMASRLEKWNAGDAPITVLEECLALSKISEAAYANR